MKNFLIAFFLFILLAMLAVTTWASNQIALWDAGPYVTDPWTIATLFDAYFGFLTFFCYLAWRERSLAAKIAWFIAIMLTGNMAMALYVLIQLFQLKPGQSVDHLFTRKSLPQAAATA